DADVVAVLVAGDRLAVERPVVGGWGRQEQAPPGPDDAREVPQELAVVEDVLDDLQAVDLVERAELGGEAVELAQVADREADPAEPDGLGAALGPGLV